MNDNALFENMEILRDKFNVTYREARDVLEEHDNNLIEALIFLEEVHSYKNGCQVSSFICDMKEKVKKLYKEGSNQRIIFSRKGKVIADIPLTAVIVGSFTFVLYPILLPFKIGGVLLLDIDIKIVDKSGKVYDVNSNVKEKVTTTIEASKGKINHIISNVDLKNAADELRAKATEFSKKAMENINEIIESKITNAMKEKSSVYAKFVYDGGRDSITEEMSDENSEIEIKIEEVLEETEEDNSQNMEEHRETEEIKDNK